MNYQVDTAAVRRAIKKIKGISENVKELSAQELSEMKSAVKDSMEGETADALEKLLTDLSQDIGKIGSGLNSVQKALSDYVVRVEKADQDAKDAIVGK